jgi:hypothetical protein
LKISKKVIALTTIAGVLVTVAAVPAQAAVKRTTTLAVTVSQETNNKGTVLVVERGGDARNSTYIEEDNGNKSWSRFGAMNGLDGRPIDAIYDFDNDRYYAKVSTALSILDNGVEGQYITDHLSPRLGEGVSKDEIAAFIAAFTAAGKNYLSVDGMVKVPSQAAALSPVLGQLEQAKEIASSASGVTVRGGCKTSQGREVCFTTFAGNVKANGTNSVTFRAWANADGTVVRASVSDGKGRVIARDVINHNAYDVITVPVADSTHYASLLPLP